MASYSIVFAILCFAALSQAALPKNWKSCSKSSKDYDKCFVREVQAAIKSLANGDKKLGVFPMDPLRITYLEIPQSPGPVSLNLIFKNLDIHGIKNLNIMHFKNDWKTLDGEIKVPSIMGLGDYKVDGKVLVLPIVGTGKANLTFDDLLLKVKITWKTIENQGKKYYQMGKIDLDLIPKRLYIQLTNLFNGDKALSDNMNNFVNENWEQILQELKPGISSALSQAFSQIANRVLSKIPTTDIEKP